MYLSYSGWKKLSDCEFAYWLAYVARLPIEGVDNMVNSLFGSVLGELFEDFYNGGYWRKNRRNGLSSEEFLDSRTKDKLLQVVKDKKRKGQVIQWKDEDPLATYKSKDELLRDLRQGIRSGLASIRFHRLIGKDARAEVKLDGTFHSHRIAGRADLLMTRIPPDEDLVLLDGKGSKPHNRKYVDPDQLRWYGMLYRHKFKRLPDKLGFLFWRAGPVESIDWLAFCEDDLSELFERVLTVANSVESRLARLESSPSLSSVRKIFRDRPSQSACRFCPYAVRKICPEGFSLTHQSD
jgi:hypothetical protein